MKIVDLRSDTVTKPSKEMFEAILNAKLGDDVYGEDPTVNKLEEMAAQKMGKEAALLVTSGTQGNLVSVMANTNKGEEVILESESHIYYYEVGGIAAVANLLVKTVKGERGVLGPGDVEDAIRPKNIHMPLTRLVCIENTHNRAGGTVWKPEQIKAVSDVVEDKGLNLYMDGARIFNSAVAQNIDVKKMTRYVDSVMFCLSKGLACPVGSVICGTEEFIEKARKYRKMLGGGMRQAGIIAAPGIIALESMVERLEEDHKNAQILAKGLKDLGFDINPVDVHTNILVFDVDNADNFLNTLRKNGINASKFGEKRVRMVTHLGIAETDIDRVLEIIETIF